MAESEPRKLLLKVILALLCLLLLLAGGAVLILWLKPDRSASARLLLPDGTTISLAGTTFGTNHVFGGTLARIVVRTPSGMQATLTRLFGSRAVVRRTFSTTTPTLVVWLNVPAVPSFPTPGPFLGWCEAYLADTNGFVSGSGQNIMYPSFGGLLPLQFSAFPRRDRTLSLHIFFHNPQGKVKDCGTLTVLNPEFRAYPQWQPETLPVTNRVGDVEATLIQMTTGLGNNFGTSWLPGGGHAVTFGTNRNDGWNVTGCQLKLESLAGTNQTWLVDHVELSDATGNVLRSTGMSWGGAGDDVFGFNPGLWTNEAAWKLRCEIKRTQGFAPGELLTFKNVPLPETYQTNQLGWTTNVNGVTVTLDYLIRRPPLTNNSWSSSQLSVAHFLMTGLSNDLHLDLIEIRADNGTNVECPSWSSSGDTQDRNLRNIPPDAKTLDITFAVQRGRWVEFLVKPETGSGRFEFPAPPKSKQPK